ncbi:MAG: zinc ABC transporter substrate-binding protein [Acidimicrobiales bacterium]|nr:zinc ABC transporter substrate-binding protein [Acidimicrobiales bacterium]
MAMRRIRLGGALVVAAILLAAAACGGDDDAVGSSGSAAAGERPEIVVTYSVLGSVVDQLVGDTADVTVIMPNGIDPHDFEPSARDIATLNGADLIVANGFGLEEGMADAIGQAEADGVPVFLATDHIDVRLIGEGEPADEHGTDGAAADEHGTDGAAADEHGTDGAAADEHGTDGDSHEHEHGDGAEDPHFWLDPASMRQAMDALAETVEAELGLDLTEQAAALDAELAALDEQVAAILEPIPAGERKLVTGHESLGYFARRYGFELVGAIIPSVTSQAQVSAGELAALREQIEASGVPAIFTEIGTPQDVADAIGRETGVVVIELPSHNLPDDGSYETFMLDVATGVASGLAPQD